MRSMRPIAAARRALAASVVALTLAIGIGANAPIASASPGCSWQPLTLLNGWHSEQNAYGTGDPSYCVTSDGMVYLSGSLAAPNGSADEFAVLPSNAWPAHYDYLNVYTMNGTLGVLRVDPDGTLNAYSGEATQFTSLAGISFPAATATEQGMMPLLNGWESAQGTYDTGDPSWFASHGAVHLDGSVLRPGGSPPPYSNEWNFAYLPSNAIPTDACFEVNVYTYDGGTWSIAINQDGSAWGANGNYTSLAGVSYPMSPMTWQPLNLLAGQNSGGGCQPLSYYVSAGVVYLTGFILLPHDFNGEIAVLPLVFRPTHTLYLDVNGEGSGVNDWVTLRIDTNGAMNIFGCVGTSGGCYISLSGLSYQSGS